MSKRHKTSWQSSPSAGLTLIEVLAALAILGTLLAGVIVAKSRAQRQGILAAQRLEAVKAADQLLVYWWNEDGVPMAASGQVPGDISMVWETVLMPNPNASGLQADVVRLRIFGQRPNRGLQQLLSVDVLRPIAVGPGGQGIQRTHKASNQPLTDLEM